MSIFDEIKQLADQNDDGKLTKDDLEGLKEKMSSEKVEELKNMADQNGDGKLNLDDVKSIDLGGALDDVKKQFGSMFG
jgi:Ca2+-binding EF-hand superfamily protein